MGELTLEDRVRASRPPPRIRYTPLGDTCPLLLRSWTRALVWVLLEPMHRLIAFLSLCRQD